MIAKNRAMKFVYFFASGFLMKAVNVLCDYSLESAFFFKIRKCLVCIVWLCVSVNQILFVIVKESLGRGKPKLKAKCRTGAELPAG